MRHPDTDHPEPWYRQFWPWFLILLPTLSVVGSIITIVIATSSPHAMVVDDYARIGLATHRKMERDSRATQLGMAAEMRVSRVPAEIRVRLEGDAPRPDHLILTLSHPTIADSDRRLAMPGHGELYSVRLEEPLVGRWYLQLAPPDGDWRLAGELPDGSETLRLVPAVRAR
jgi:hypothetical protein